MLKHLGVPWTLRLLSLAILVLAAPTLQFVKGRLPETRIRGPAPRNTNNFWLRDRTFWVLIVANTIQGFAYFVPIIWLPTFASALGLQDSRSSLTLALLNGVFYKFSGFQLATDKFRRRFCARQVDDGLHVGQNRSLGFGHLQLSLNICGHFRPMGRFITLLSSATVICARLWESHRRLI